MPSLETFRNVLVVPYSRPWEGGVDHANCPAHARIARGPDFIDRFPENTGRPHKRVAGTFLYGGPLKMHFGHVISDSVPRLHAFDPERHHGVVFAPLGNTHPAPAWFHDILALFGVKPSHVIQASEPTVFGSMDFAQPGTVVRRGPEKWYLKHLRSLNIQPAATGPTKLFIGRRHIIGQGGVMGESYFAALLARSGFASIMPEQHPLHAQLALMAGARHIVFTEGSGILATDLLPSLDATVYMIPRRNGGEALFGPQLAARARGFQLLSGPEGVLRLENHRGMRKPDSPSYLARPDAVHSELAAAGLVDGGFDHARFQEAERRDAQAYWNGDIAAAQAQIELAREARRSLPG